VTASWNTWISTEREASAQGDDLVDEYHPSQSSVNQGGDTLRSAASQQYQTSEHYQSEDGQDYPVRPVEQLLGQELSSERHRRHQAEQSARVLLARMQEEQDRANEGLSRYEQCLETIQQLERALKAAGQRIDDLVETKDQLHATNNQGRLEMERLKQQHDQVQNHLNLERDQHQKDVDQIMSLKESLQSLRLMQVERVKTLEIELAGAAQEVESANRASRASRKQVSKLQELLATKESEYRADKENMVHIHGPEVRL
jgi:chromosome segregation ATPase